MRKKERDASSPRVGGEPYLYKDEYALVGSFPHPNSCLRHLSFPAKRQFLLQYLSNYSCS